MFTNQQNRVICSMGDKSNETSNYYCQDSKLELEGFVGVWISINFVVGLVTNLFTLIAIPYAKKKKK